MADNNLARPDAVATAAVVTILATTNQIVQVRQIDWSFDASLDDPVELIVEVDSVIQYAMHITSPGPGQLQFPASDPLRLPKASTDTVFTLPSGGAAVTGTLNVLVV